MCCQHVAFISVDVWLPTIIKQEMAVEAAKELWDVWQEAKQHLVGQLTIEYPLTRAAPDPPKRRRRARSRRRRRLPFQTKGVGLRFQPATVCSNQSMICCASLGCRPARARGTMR